MFAFAPTFSTPSTASKLWELVLSDKSNQWIDLIDDFCDHSMPLKKFEDFLRCCENEEQVKYIVTILILHGSARRLEIENDSPPAHDPLPELDFQEAVLLAHLADRLHMQELRSLAVGKIYDELVYVPYMCPCAYEFVFGRGMAVAKAVKLDGDLALPKALAMRMLSNNGRGESFHNEKRLVELAANNSVFMEALQESSG